MVNHFIQKKDIKEVNVIIIKKEKEGKADLFNTNKNNHKKTNILL